MKNERKETSLWPPSIVKVFIEIMIDEVNKGSMRNNVFSRKVWQTMLHALNGRAWREYDMKQIKQKFNRLRQQHREFSHLLQQNGFGRDAEMNIVTATEEAWSSYLQAHPNAAPFKKKGLEHYKLLGLIFNKSGETGVLHHSPTQGPPNTHDENELDSAYLPSEIHVNLDDDEDDKEDSPIIESLMRSGKRTINVQDHKSKKERRALQKGDAPQAWIESSKLIAEAYVEASKRRAEALLANADRYGAKSVAATSSAVISSEYTMGRCVTELNEIDGVSDDTYAKAVEKFKDVDYREAFLSMTADRKKAWIRRLV